MTSGRMIGVIAIVLLLLSASVSTAQVGTQAIADQLVVPGERIGGVQLGMGLSEGIAAGITTFGGRLEQAKDCTRKEDQGKVRCTLRSWISDKYISVLGFVGPEDEVEAASDHDSETGISNHGRTGTRLDAGPIRRHLRRARGIRSGHADGK